MGLHCIGQEPVPAVTAAGADTDTREHLYFLSRKIGLRPLGSPGWGAAREYIKSTIAGCGYGPTVIAHKVDLLFPLRATVEVLGSGRPSVTCLGALGSPSAHIQGPLWVAGGGARLSAAPPNDGAGVLLVPLRKKPAWEEVERAAGKGAAAALLFDPEYPGLRAVVVARGVAPIPAASIRRSDARRLMRYLPEVRLSVVADRRSIECESLAAVVGHGTPRLLFMANYDTWPKSLGPVGGAVGVAVALGLLGRLRSWKEPAILFAFLDAEMVGGHGSRVLSQRLAREGLVTGLTLVVDVTKLGLPGPLLVTCTDGPVRIAARAATSIGEALERAGYSPTVQVGEPEGEGAIARGPRPVPAVRLRGRGLSPADLRLASSLEDAFHSLLGSGLLAG